MKASETSLQQMFEGIKQYVVPLFQRSYSWDTSEWGKLWDDLIELTEIENPRDHFIGSIVTIPTTSVPEGVVKYLLIDGQQRLTTIFILLALIRDKLRTSSKKSVIESLKETEEADELNNVLIVNQYKHGMDHFKLLPTQVDRIAYQSIVNPSVEVEMSINSQLKKAYDYFERKLKRSKVDLHNLKKKITNKLTVVSIILESDDNPYLVFEGLNATGRPLTQADLIKNFFFMQIHTDEHDSVFEKYWNPMQESLDSQLTEYIRHYLMKDGLIVSTNSVYPTLKEKVKQKNAYDILKDIYKYSKYYQKILDPKKESNKDLSRALERINKLDLTTVYPFLLNCYHEYNENLITINQLNEVIKIVENFLIRRYICNYPTDRLKNIFPFLFSQIKTTSVDFIEGLKSILQSKGYPKDLEFKNKFMSINMYDGRDRYKKTRLILEGIERSFGHKEEVSFDDSNISIEHIMPQTLSEHWQNYLGNDWDDTHELYLHTFGNLTLTAYNSELSNDTFEKKKKFFNGSHIELNKYFTQCDVWKREDIEKRSMFLADKASEIWYYFGDDNTGCFNTVVTGNNPTLLTILGQSVEVSSWRDVLEQTLNVISDLEPESFEQLSKDYPKHIGEDSSRFRAIKELKNGRFIEVNMSAKEIQKFCIQVIGHIGLANDEWIIDTVD